MKQTDTHNQLNRSITLPILILYGMGTMVGGGIYALLGKMAGASGVLTPFVFLVSAFVACLTAYSYSQLSSRYPVSAGEAKFVSVAFNSKVLSQIIGLMVVFTGLASISTLLKAGAGFVFDLSNGFIHESLSVFALVALLVFFCYRDIGLSTKLIATITCIEVLGLLFIIGANASLFSQIPEFMTRVDAFVADYSFTDLSLFMMSGAFLAFYAFIGFEDMVNVSEEVKEPRKTMPKAIMIAFLLTTILYVLIAFIAVTKVDIGLLSEAKTPLALLIGGEGQEVSPMMMGLISLIAGLNGALVQLIMVSRVLYGLSKEGKAPRFLSELHAKHKTPVKALLLLAWITLCCALLLPVKSLASYASGIILLVFAFVNISLFIICLKEKANIFSIKPLIALLGTICCLSLWYSIF